MKSDKEKKLFAQILVRIALIDNHLASEEVVCARDITDNLGLSSTYVDQLFDKFKKERNDWSKVKPLIENVKRNSSRLELIDNVKAIIDSDHVVEEIEVAALDKIYELWGWNDNREFEPVSDD